jgi:oligopeptide transport system substrate-binding protein
MPRLPCFSVRHPYLRKHRIWTQLTAALLLLCSGCFRSEAPANLVIVNGNEPESLDPAIVTGVSEMRVTKALFDGLLHVDATNARPVAALAERWDVSPDGKLYTFYLRSNLLWSTGEPITTTDVVYSWLRALSPATAADYAGQLFYIKNAESFFLGKLTDPNQVGIHAVDGRTLRVELNTPLAFFLDLCCFPTLAVVPRQTIDVYGDRWLSHQPLPCSGPFQLQAWRPNDKVRLRKNPHYWDAAHTQSDVIDLLPIGSPNAALNLYETHVADVVWDKDLIPAELLDVLIKRADFHSYDYLGLWFYRFNVTRKPLDDARVRRAFALATDKERLVRKLMRGGEKPANHFVPDGVANYQSPPALPFDPAQGRKLLGEAGFPGGKGFPRLQFSFYSGAGGIGKVQEKLAVELQQMWREELGVEIELRQIERTIFYGAQSRLDFDLSASSWIGDYNDANTFLDLFTSNSGNNRTGWKSARYDALMHEANLQTDVKRRAGFFQQAESLLTRDEAPVVPVYFYIGFNYFDPKKVSGIFQNLLDEHPLQTIRRL